MARTKLTLALLFALAGSLSATGQEKTAGSVKVKIQDEKSEFFEPVVPVDQARRVEYQAGGPLNLRVTCENRMLHLGFMWTALKIDDQVLMYGGGGAWRIESQNLALPKTASGKTRDGSLSVVWFGKIRITQMVEVVPASKPGEKKRQRDTVLVRYTIENKDNVPHRVGLRKSMDVFVVNNDGALFAAPTHPGKILDGIELKGKTMPPYLQFLQVPNLAAPGFVGHMTFDLGNSVEKPSRAILTSLRAVAFNNWDMQVMQAQGDSAMSIYWEPKEIKTGAKRELAFAFGGGVARKLENEGRLKIDLAGSFEPGRLFTVSAYVLDPAQGQNLTLMLPAGMQLVEGSDTQPVARVDGDGLSMVRWRARVLRTGDFTLRIDSSLGATLTRNVSITPIDGK